MASFEQNSSKFLSTFIWSDPDIVHMGMNDQGQYIDLYRERGLGDHHPLIALVYEKKDLSDMTCYSLLGTDPDFYMGNPRRELVRLRGALHWVRKGLFTKEPRIRIHLYANGEMELQQCFEDTTDSYEDTEENRVKLRAIIDN